MEKIESDESGEEILKQRSTYWTRKKLKQSEPIGDVHKNVEGYFIFWPYA